MKKWIYEKLGRWMIWPVLALTAFMAGYLWVGGSSSAEGEVDIHMHHEAAAPGMLYVCPMMCVPPMKHGGKCPVCGMDMTPVNDASDGPGNNKAPTLKLTAAAVRQSGIQVAPVERKMVTAEIRLYGKIEYDPVEQFKVTAFSPGVIDRVYIQRAGQTVRIGDPLVDMHSSELYFLEQELVEILKDLPYQESLFPARGQRAQRLMRPATPTMFGKVDPKADAAEQARQKEAWSRFDKVRRKMQLLGLTDEAIDNVILRGRPTGISTITTPTTGVILEQNAFKGSYLNTGETIFTIGNPSYMWAKLTAYESDFGWLRVGQEADFETDAFPGETFRGRVRYLDPNFDPQTRTFFVGVLYIDPKSRLAPNMLVRCVVRAQMTAEGVAVPGAPGQTAPLVIPETAPLITGERAIVYVANPQKTGEYEGREVLLGPRAKGYYIVRRGLKKGEMVVVNGGFKIDSAVQILARSSMMSIPGDRPALEHHSHGGSSAMQVLEAASSDMPAPVEPEQSTVSSRSASRSRSYEDRLDELMNRRRPAADTQK